MREYRFRGKKQDILVEVVYSGRKSMALQVKEDGRVIARMPQHISDEVCIQFIKQHQDWIEKYLERVLSKYTGKNESRFPDWECLGAKERQQMKAKIEDAVAYCSRCMGGISYGRVSVRNQKTRWGSCSAAGNLNFNYRICYLPKELFLYVIVHELAHRRHMDHSEAFWREVECYLPEYKEYRKRLKEIVI